MGWFGRFLTSSLGKKLIMSLTGLFLIVFLIVHLAGNLQLLAPDDGQAFNQYAKFMTTNPVIKTVSYLLYAFILIHAVQGMLLWRQNRVARGSQPYTLHIVRGAAGHPARIASRMGWIGVVIFVFLLIHLYQFWLQMKLDALSYVVYEGTGVRDLFVPVKEVFTDLGFVIFYVVSMYVIAVHLWHGFESSFQTLGLNHRKYTPLIRWLGRAYAILIPLGFALIPVLFYLRYA